jgi:hypothetical protein
MAEIEKFRLSVSMNATVTIFNDAGEATDWLRPGTESATTWRGMPSQEELILAYREMSNVAGVTLEDVLTSSRQRIEEYKAGG